MRLICPNCGAQYEVADDVIPQDGRDVQCSNCAHTWFESHGAPDVTDVLAEQSAAAPAVADDDDDDDDDDDEPWGAEAYAAKPVVAAKPATKRQELAPAIADILREEAARETAARRAEADAMESQPDLGLDSADAAPDQRSVEAKKRMADRKDLPPIPAGAASRAAIAAASRGDLLPDIEEINSSLRSSTERGLSFPDPIPEPKERKRGARTGFFGMLLILAVFTAVYISAPKIRSVVPAADAQLTTYVDTVDNARLWLNAQFRRVTDGTANEDVATPMAVPETAPTVSTEAPEMAPVTP